MFLYVGDYWVPFPSSEYGGTWVVMAENDEQVIDILKEYSYDDEDNDYIPNVVTQAERFKLDTNALSEDVKPHLVDNFFT